MLERVDAGSNITTNVQGGRDDTILREPETSAPTPTLATASSADTNPESFNNPQASLLELLLTQTSSMGSKPSHSLLGGFVGLK
ncbi:hypothetical protein TIFTF001_055316 [Ficus carica]|uniref:Uncharacterized protein n=1 Tax=Ficus carica TaxID=3494 RepID=A0AA88EEB6_FICCA|nr:hypothetical protein TIFTF001_055316 [Ficus carica]